MVHCDLDQFQARLEQVVKIVEALANLPDGDADAELLGQIQAVLDKLERRVVDGVSGAGLLVLEPMLVIRGAPLELRLVLLQNLQILGAKQKTTVKRSETHV